MDTCDEALELSWEPRRMWVQPLPCSIQENRSLHACIVFVVVLVQGSEGVRSGALSLPLSLPLSPVGDTRRSIHAYSYNRARSSDMVFALLSVGVCSTGSLGSVIAYCI